MRKCILASPDKPSLGSNLCQRFFDTNDVYYESSIFIDDSAQEHGVSILQEYHNQTGKNFSSSLLWKEAAIFNIRQTHNHLEGYNIPFEVHDKLYSLTNSRGEITLITDHKGSFIPTDDTYEAIKKQRMTPIQAKLFFLEALSRIDFCYFHEAKTRLAGIAEEAKKKTGLELAFSDKDARETVFFSNAAHCYVVHAGSELVVRDGLERMFEQNGENQEMVVAKIINGINENNIEDMIDLGLIDVPVNEKSGGRFLSFVSQELFRRDANETVTIDPEKIFAFMRKAYAFSHETANLEEYPLHPLWTKEQAVLALALHNFIQTSESKTQAQDSLDRMIGLAQAKPNFSMPAPLFQGIKDFCEIEDHFEAFQVERGTEKLAVDLSTQGTLHFEDTVQALSCFGQNYSMKDNLQQEASQRLAISDVPYRLRFNDVLLSQNPTPKCPTVWFNQRERDSYPVCYHGDAPILELADREDVIFPTQSLPRFLQELENFQAFLANTHIQRQCNPASYQICQEFINYYIKTIGEYISAPDKQGAMGLDQFNPFYKIVERFPDLKMAFRETGVDIFFGYQVGAMMAQANRSFGTQFHEVQSYPILAESPRLLAGSNFRPWHLVLSDTAQTKMVMVETGKIFIRDLDDFKAQRLLAILQKYQFTEDERIVCINHVEDRNDQTDRDIAFPMTSADKAIIRRYLNRVGELGNLEAARQLWSLAGKDIAKSLENFQNNMNWDDLLNAQRIAQAINNAWHIQPSVISETFHYSNPLEEDYILRRFNHLREVYENRARPIGIDLEISPRRPFIIFAPHGEGKSELLRSLSYALLCGSHGMPAAGEFSADKDTTPQALLERTEQGPSNSLFFGQNQWLEEHFSMIDSSNYFLLIDELGRHTRRTYGEALLGAVIIIAALRNDHTLQAIATHYMDFQKFLPLLRGLGIDPQFVTLENYCLRAIKPGEIIVSRAVKTIADFTGREYLHLWPQKEDLRVASMEDKQDMFSDKKDETCEELSKSDLLGIGEKRTTNLCKIFDVDAGVAHCIDRDILTNEGENWQTRFRQVFQIEKRREMLNRVYRLRSYMEIEKTSDFSSYQDRLRSFFRLNFDASFSEIQKGREEMISEYNEAIGIIDQTVDFGTYLDLKQMSYSYHDHTKTDDEFNKRLTSLQAFLKVSDFLEGNHCCEAVFTNGSVLTGKNCWNPLLSEQKTRSKIIPNDFVFDFGDNQAGELATGENSSGKSNYCRGDVSFNIFLAQNTGYATGSIQIPRKLKLLSLTNPVYDRSGLSGMEAEAYDRIRPAIQALKNKDDFVFTIIDEPGTSTSPDDEAKIVRWLFRCYQTNSRAKLLTNTHCFEVAEQLQNNGVQFTSTGFHLLSTNTPFKATKGTVDSNAFAIARSLGKNKNLIDIAEIIYDHNERLKRNEQVDTSVYVARIKEILTAKV